MPHRVRPAVAPSHVPQARQSPNTGSARPGAGARTAAGCSQDAHCTQLWDARGAQPPWGPPHGQDTPALALAWPLTAAPCSVPCPAGPGRIQGPGRSQGPGKALGGPRQRALAVTPPTPAYLPHTAPPPWWLLHYPLPGALLARGVSGAASSPGQGHGASPQHWAPAGSSPAPTAAASSRRSKHTDTWFLGTSGSPRSLPGQSQPHSRPQGRTLHTPQPVLLGGSGPAPASAAPAPRQPRWEGTLCPPRRAAPSRLLLGQDLAPSRAPGTAVLAADSSRLAHRRAPVPPTQTPAPLPTPAHPRGPAGVPGHPTAPLSWTSAEGSASSAPLALARGPACRRQRASLRTTSRPAAGGAQRAPHPPDGPCSPRAIPAGGSPRTGLAGASRAPGFGTVPSSSEHRNPSPSSLQGAPSRGCTHPGSGTTLPHALLRCPGPRGSPATAPGRRCRHSRAPGEAVSQAARYRKEQRAAISFQNVSCLCRAASPGLLAASSTTAACVVPAEGVGLAPPPRSAPHSSPVPEPGTTSARSGSVGLSPPGRPAARDGSPGTDAGVQHGGRWDGLTCTPCFTDTPLAPGQSLHWQHRGASKQPLGPLAQLRAAGRGWWVPGRGGTSAEGRSAGNGAACPFYACLWFPAFG